MWHGDFAGGAALGGSRHGDRANSGYRGGYAQDRRIGGPEVVIKKRPRLLNLHEIIKFQEFTGGPGGSSALSSNTEKTAVGPTGVTQRDKDAEVSGSKPGREGRYAGTGANRPLHRIPAQSRNCWPGQRGRS